jgi:hypothetical protein
MKHAPPAEHARPGPRPPAGQAVPLNADVFALPARRLRDLMREQAAAGQCDDDTQGERQPRPDNTTTGG